MPIQRLQDCQTSLPILRIMRGEQGRNGTADLTEIPEIGGDRVSLEASFARPKGCFLREAARNGDGRRFRLVWNIGRVDDNPQGQVCGCYGKNLFERTPTGAPSECERAGIGKDNKCDKEY